MKNNAIVRIVLFSIAIPVLVGILLAGLGVGLYMGNYTVNTSSYNEILQPGQGNSVTVNASEIRNLEIEWAAGSITITPAGGTDQIVINESKVTDQKYQMVCRESGDKLIIQFCEENTISGFGINFNTDISKDLEILVPTDWVCEDLEIDAAAANVMVSDMMIYKVDFDGASGVCTFENCAVEEIDLDAASGDVHFSGTLNSLAFDGMSASCYLELRNVPQRIDLNTMSGDLDVTLPEYCGFTVSMDAMSSDFSSEFETTSSNGNHIHGDGSCHINVDAMSGDVFIRKGATASYANTTDHHEHTDECYAANSTCPDYGHH